MAWIKHDYKVAIKRFYKWLNGGAREDPTTVKWIKTTFKKKDALLSKNLLTEEVQQQVNTANSS